MAADKPRTTMPSIEAIREIVRKATPGPWRVWTSNSFKRITSEADHNRVDGGVLSAVTNRHDGVPDLTGYNINADLDFICVARDVLPAFLEEIESLKAELKTARRNIAQMAEVIEYLRG